MPEVAGRALGEFSDYDGLLTAVRARVKELEVNGEAFDEFAGLPIGYLSKLIGVRPSRRIANISMGPLFQALGIYCVVLEDPQATARLKKQLKPRNGSYVRTTQTHFTMTDRRWAKIQKLGRAARWQGKTKQQKVAAARHAAQARWHGHNGADR